MVKHPNKQKSHCVKCNTYTQHSVGIYKARKASPRAQGQRKYDILNTGYGGKKRQQLKKKAKSTKKATIRLTCSACKRMKTQVLGRAKKIELVNVQDK
eukprot:GAHX01000437.1.p1 GENE.GAHX01000437.1~~GAHX01000437.1.p1  ORF type:complete len:98 (+),score=16.83 GAHX01000437.1:31-324(+)